MSKDIQDDFEQGLLVAQKAAELARTRMGIAGDAPPGPTPIRAALATMPSVRVVRDMPAPVSLEDRAARKLARLCAKIPPSFQWAELGTRLLAERVPSAQAREASARSIQEPRIVWTGQSGSGKTSLAAALFRACAKRLVEMGVRAEFEPAWRLAGARARHPLGEGEPDIVQAAFRSELLVLDDLGTDKAVPSSPLEEIVFERHWNALATWVTTWMTTEQVSNRYGEGFARRIFQGALVIDCGGKT